MLLPPPLFLSLYYYLKYVLSLSLFNLSLYVYKYRGRRGGMLGGGESVGE
jgi:hypothetical protein